MPRVKLQVLIDVSFPGRWIYYPLHYLQLCDALAERPSDSATLLHQARAERLMPGDGERARRMLAKTRQLLAVL